MKTNAGDWAYRWAKAFLNAEHGPFGIQFDMRSNDPDDILALAKLLRRAAARTVAKGKSKRSLKV